MLVRGQVSAALSDRYAAGVRAGLRRLADLGYAPSAATLDLVAPYVPEAELAALRLRFDANRRPVEASREILTVPATRRLIEGIAWDPSHARLFAGSVVERVLLRWDGRTWPVVRVNAGSVFGLAVDDRRKLLWIASGVVDQTASPETAFRGLIALDLDTLRTVRRVPIEGEGSPADIAVGPDGTVFASDPLRGTIYRLGADDDEVSIALPPGRLRNPQGLVPASDGRRLYVSDYGHGLAVLDLGDGSLTRLESDVDTMLDGIDGLTAWEGGLIAVQNGTSPRRILHLSLDSDGSRIVGVRIVERAHPEWGEPTLGFVDGDVFVYVADAQWERFGPGGALIGEAPLRPTAIRSVPLRPGAERPAN